MREGGAGKGFLATEYILVHRGRGCCVGVGESMGGAIWLCLFFKEEEKLDLVLRREFLLAVEADMAHRGVCCTLCDVDSRGVMAGGDAGVGLTAVELGAYLHGRILCVCGGKCMCWVWVT